MGKIKLSPIQQRENRRRFKATNKELMQIAAGINHIVITHDSLWSLMPGFDNDKVFDVAFSRPVLKRPLTENDKMVAVEWAKYHPRFWRVVLTLELFDGQTWYPESAEIVTSEPIKLNALKDFVDASWKDLEGGANSKHIRGKRWSATIVKTHELRAANEN